MDAFAILMPVSLLQLQEENVLLEVQITEWTPAGLIAKIEVKLYF